ncbi:TcdA/TcdB catalytic glycosyltransferase domain-containing protein [Streptomyces albidoflavus]
MRTHDRDAQQVGREGARPFRAGRAVGLNSHWVTHLQRIASQPEAASAGPSQEAADHAAQVQRAAVNEALQSPSRPLNPSLRQEMEARYDGADFGGVRVHDGVVARKAAGLVDARAFAVDGHIVDGGSMSKKDWAHELAHTLDPEPAVGTDNGAGLSISSPRDRGEQFADAAADQAMSRSVPVQRVSAEGQQATGAGHRHGEKCDDGRHQPAGGDRPVQRVATAEAAAPGRQDGITAAVQRAPGGTAATDERAEERQGAEAARGESLQLHDHLRNELHSGDVEQLTAYVRHLAQEDRPDIYRLLLQRLHDRKADAQAAALQQVWNGAEKARSARRVPVPKDLHFIWLGGAPSESAVVNLKEWKENAEESDWTLNLWTDGNSSAFKSLEKDFGGHLKLRTDSDKFVKEKAGEDKARRKENYELYKNAKSKKAYNLSSDILRYAVMKEYGGVYMDIDVAPGSVQLTAAPEVLMRSEEIPLLAPRLRDKSSVNKELDRKNPDQDPTQGELEEAATGRYRKGVLGNNFILAPGSEFMSELLEKLPKHFADLKEKYGDKVIDGDLPGFAPDISGPAFVEKVLKLYTGQHHRVMEQPHSTAEAPEVAISATEFQSLFPPEALEFWKSLGWVTPESERQLDGVPGLSRTQSLLRALKMKK